MINAWTICSVILLVSGFSALAAGNSPAPIKVAVVQMPLATNIVANRDRIIAGISNAAARGARVAVFPEGALRGEGNKSPEIVSAAERTIRDAARAGNIYVLFGGLSYSAKIKKEANWMSVVDPNGRETFRYNKLYDQHDAKMPGTFEIDGIPCGTMICADRWLRGVAELPIQQGAQISFELSCNFASEWVAPFGWYWNVPRALRNNVWVVFANSGNKVSGVSDSADRRELRHGHSAIIAPDGRVTAAAQDDVQTIVVGDIDVSQVTRSNALARAANPVLHPFWEAGLALQRGEKITAPPFSPFSSVASDVTLAIAQVTNDLGLMERRIAEARASGCDLIAFPERSVPESALAQLQAAARKHYVTVVFGAAHREKERLRNSAFVIGPDGVLLTRYDQLSAEVPFEAGKDPGTMWFRVKGVAAVVTVGRDTLWTELAELAAVAGAQIHIHLDNQPSSDWETDLRKLQVAANLASFMTFTAVADVTGSAIWDDLRAADETRAEVKDIPRPNTGKVEVYSPFSANLVCRSGAGSGLLIATRRVAQTNPHHPSRTSKFNLEMEPWYRLGASLIQGGNALPR